MFVLDFFDYFLELHVSRCKWFVEEGCIKHHEFYILPQCVIWLFSACYAHQLLKLASIKPQFSIQICCWPSLHKTGWKVYCVTISSVHFTPTPNHTHAIQFLGQQIIGWIDILCPKLCKQTRYGLAIAWRTEIECLS
jgi:hypothetical protein